MNKGDLVSVNETLWRRVYIGDKRYIDKRTGRPTSRAFAPGPKMKLSFLLTLKV